MGEKAILILLSEVKNDPESVEAILKTDQILYTISVSDVLPDSNCTQLKVVSITVTVSPCS